MPTIHEADVLRLFLARTDNYAVSQILPVRGRIYDVTMGGQHYRAVLLTSSFAYYELRYHLATDKPTLVICFEHDTVLPVHVLSLRVGNLAQPYEMPQEIEDLEGQRHSRRGCHVLLGMYLSGMKWAQTLVNELPTSTKNRYLRRAKELGRRKRGRPVGSLLSSQGAC